MKQNDEAKCGTICPFVRARSSETANWGASSGARRIWAGVHLLVDCLPPGKQNTTNTPLHINNNNNNNNNNALA